MPLWFNVKTLLILVDSDLNYIAFFCVENAIRSFAFQCNFQGYNFLSNFQSASLINQHFELLVFLKGACQPQIELWFAYLSTA